MKKFFQLLMLMILHNTCLAQGFVTYNSVQGTWDKTKSSERAQFGGNNFILHHYVAQYTSQFFNVGLTRNSKINATAEISFRVNHNNIDSLIFLKSSGIGELDSVMKSVLESTSGKWRPGIVNGDTLKETIIIWIHIYFGEIKKRPLDLVQKEAASYFDTEHFEKAIKAYDEVLEYDELSNNAVTKKGQCLIKLERREEACSLWKSFLKYQTKEMLNLIQDNCK